MSANEPVDLFSTDELYLAYRKAKADLFFERSIPNAKQFAVYEDNLESNINELHRRLIDESANPWFNDLSFIGGVSFAPKSLDPCTCHDDEPKFFASSAIDNWNRILDESNERLEVTFRPMANFTVDMHVACALWVNHVGQHMDACLNDSALGSRIRRIAGTQEYHRSVWHSFQPYFRSYKKWRDDGFAAIRAELNKGNKVVALTLDFRRFFHQIDPRFLQNSDFLAILSEAGFNQSDAQVMFTSRLIKAFETWGNSIPGQAEERPVGLPVGATPSRIIANVLLLKFDQWVRQSLSPVYYARYVDDIFLVIRDNGSFKCGKDVLNWILSRPDSPVHDDTKSGTLKVSLPYSERSEIEFQTSKQRIFLIDNADLLNAIQAKVDEVSSEWRLLPDLRQMEQSAAAKTLSTSGDGTSDGDSLRKTDTLLLKRLGFAILLRNADAISDAIPSREWRPERHEFYEFALRHVIAPYKLFELIDYIPRLISLCVRCEDWQYAKRIVQVVYEIFKRIRDRAYVMAIGVELDGDESAKAWNGFFANLRSSFEEALLKSIRPTKSQRLLGRYKALYTLIGNISLEIDDILQDPDFVLPKKLFDRDLGRRPFKSFLLGEQRRHFADFPAPLPQNLPLTLAHRSKEIRSILQRIHKEEVSAMPLLFPTRPLSPEDVSVLLPNVAADVDELKRVLNTLRGTFYKTGDGARSTRKSRVVTIGHSGSSPTPRVAVTSLLTEPSSWCASAGKKPDLSYKRFERLVELCNAILRTTSDVRPHYVLFPELSIPRRWTRMIAESLLRSRISVIAGEEYSHLGRGYVENNAKIYLTDNRLGYPSWCVLTQHKVNPAHHEREELRRKFGLEMRPRDASTSKKRPIYNHCGFRFGLLICSELTDMKLRVRFRGKIDALFVLSWNQDLESFSALVDATSLDVHCFVAIVNNRLFGDSRVRAPYRDAWLRDAVRVKGGLADYFVVASLDVQSLREFQSHVEPPESPFKPFPEGFSISGQRRRIPGC